MSNNRGMNKEDVVHIYNGILARKKNEIRPFAATWMDLETITPNEVSQTVKCKHHMISPIRGILKKKKDTNELIFKNRNRHRL